MDYKWLSFVLTLILLVLFGVMFVNIYVMKSNVNYANYEIMVGSEGQSELLSFIPSSSTNINEFQDFDSGEVRVSFEYNVNDVSSIDDVCIKVLKDPSSTKYVCPPYETRTNTLLLRPNGQASFFSYVTNN